MFFPNPSGWERVARKTCENLNAQHALCSDIREIVEPWTRPVNYAAPSERCDTNKLWAAAALIVNCARLSLALFRGDQVDSIAVQPQPIRGLGNLEREVDRCLGDVSRWVADDVRSVVIDAAVRAVFEVEGDEVQPKIET
jgi:hypothetical protein